MRRRNVRVARIKSFSFLTIALQGRGQDRADRARQPAPLQWFIIRGPN
jgi:hypothetical protein